MRMLFYQPEDVFGHLQRGLISVHAGEFRQSIDRKAIRIQVLLIV
jgi:hypothetical protein